MGKLIGPSHFKLAGHLTQDLQQKYHIYSPLFICSHFSFAFCSCPVILSWSRSVSFWEEMVVSVAQGLVECSPLQS